MDEQRSRAESYGSDGECALVGRNVDGTFAPGNRIGRGNPMAARMAKIRCELIEATRSDDVRAIWAKVISMAKAGDLAAATIVLDRVHPKPRPGDGVDGDQVAVKVVYLPAAVAAQL